MLFIIKRRVFYKKFDFIFILTSYIDEIICNIKFNIYIFKQL